MSGGGGSDDTWRPDVKPVPGPKGSKGGSGKGGGGQADPCNIVETTTLNSANRTVVSTLRVGDLLDVVFQPGPPQRLVAEKSPNVIAGSITSPAMLQIIQCIVQGGNQYVAEVQSIRGAVCQVKVQRK